MGENDIAKRMFFEGLMYLENRRFADAETRFLETLKLVPRSIPTLNNLAITQFEQGKLGEAALTAQKAIETDPRNIDAYVLLSTCQKDQGQYQEALKTCRAIIAINPTIAEAHCNLGYALNKIEKYQEALASFDRAIVLRPQFADAFLNRGNSLYNLKRYDEAFAAYGKALTLKPDLPEAWLGRGHAFTELKRYDEAFAAYDNALALKPDFAEAWLGRGHLYDYLHRYDEAFAAYDKALALKPDLANAHYHEGFLRLLLGDLESGWKKYEFRWETREGRNLKRYYFQPLWLGDDPLTKKTILLYAEQGFGDTIMACRYVPMVAALGASVILEVQPPLVSLVKSLEGVSKVIAKGDAIPNFDVHCPLMSLPLAFKTRLETIPANVPYLSASKEKIEQWHSRLSNGGFKIAMAWAGNPNFKEDRDRSILLKNVLPIFSIKGAKFFSIQKELRDGDLEILNANSQIVQLGSEINDFQDTAAIMMSLDLIISSDTSVVNLAGALARPIWVLLPFNPDWRWLLIRKDSPWYPTARLFRQAKSGDWGGVVDDVCAELEKLLIPHATGRGAG